MTSRKFLPLSGRLIRRTVLLALLCMVVVLGIQAFFLQQQSKPRYENLVEEVGSTNMALLAVALWDIELAAVQAQVQTIAKRPEIGFVRVRAASGQRFEAGAPELAAQKPTHVMPITAPGSAMVLGQLELTGNPHYLVDGIKMAALRVLLGYGGFTVVICLLMAVMLRRDLQQPLEKMARFASELTPQQLMTPLVLDRPHHEHVDEIDLMAEGFAKLQAGLREHITRLDGLVAERTTQLEKLVKEIQLLSITDALTGVYNRRSIDERLPVEVERARRYAHPLTLMFTDLDHFKQINDTFGHVVGDTVLREVAHYLQSQLRQGVDWIARYGGEEFLIVLPETGLDAAVDAANRLRAGIETLCIAAEGDVHLSVKVSFGLTSYREGEAVDALLARVDALLYRAKTEGRNRVVAEA